MTLVWISINLWVFNYSYKVYWLNVSIFYFNLYIESSEIIILQLGYLFVYNFIEQQKFIFLEHGESKSKKNRKF